MNNTKKKTSHQQQKTFNLNLIKQTHETFLKRIKEIEGQEKEGLLKRYTEIVEELK